MGLAISMALAPVSLAQLSTPGGYFNVFSRLCAMVGSYLLLVMVLLAARFVPLERALGQPRLISLHRRLAAWPIVLIILHVVLVTLGYAMASHTHVVTQVKVLLSSYHNMTEAFVALGVILVATLVSTPVVRRLMDYENWWIIHLSFYGALVLSLPHQLTNGVMFINHPLSRYVWLSMWLTTGAILVYSRLVVPLRLNLRHRLRVHTITPEAGGSFSITVVGERLESLGVAGGQFFQWRFVAPGLLVHSHPYSLSAMPRPPYLRLTVKASGDHAKRLNRLHPGTRVLVEGPYGALTHHHAKTSKLTLIAAGVGVTPLRAMLEDIPKDTDLTMLMRAPSLSEIPHEDELRDYLAHRGAKYVPILGSRHAHPMTPADLLDIVPDLTKGDVFLCGPPDFTEQLLDSLFTLGVPADRIHHEMFTF